MNLLAFQLLLWLIPGSLLPAEQTTSGTWYELSEMEQLDSIFIRSKERPVIIYKHSTRCGICTVTLGRLKSGWSELSLKADLYYLDLWQYRSISDKVAELFLVRHESPQVLIIKNGKVIYTESHYKIEVDKILQYL